jgi:uncharacterized DUF497 family protein
MALSLTLQPTGVSTASPMQLEWDERKRQANIAKHEIDFVGAAKIFDSPILEVEDRRRDYGEVRFRVLGEIGGEMICLVYICVVGVDASSAPGRRVVMKKKYITRVSRDQLRETIDKTDWDRIAALSEA